MFLTSWSTSGIYGIEWDHGSEVVEMSPVQRGPIRSRAFASWKPPTPNLKQQEPIVPEEFVKRYATERFGLSAADGAKLWRSLTLNGTPIQHGVDVPALHAKALEIKKTLLHFFRFDMGMDSDVPG